MCQIYKNSTFASKTINNYPEIAYYLIRKSAGGVAPTDCLNIIVIFEFIGMMVLQLVNNIRNIRPCGKSSAQKIK